MYSTRLSFVEIANDATLELCVPYGFVGAGKSNLGTDALTIVECEDGCALLGGCKRIVVHVDYFLKFL